MFVLTGCAIDQSGIDVEEVDPNVMMATFFLVLSCGRCAVRRIDFLDSPVTKTAVHDRRPHFTAGREVALGFCQKDQMFLDVLDDGLTSCLIVRRILEVVHVRGKSSFQLSSDGQSVS